MRPTKQQQFNERTTMKGKIIAGFIAAILLAGGAAFEALAQNGPGQGQGNNGLGYGGPPQSEEERALRQLLCLEKNDGVCPNGGPRAGGQGYGQGKGLQQGPRDGTGPRAGQRNGQGRGMGEGKGLRQGPRDGTGPRGGTGACPVPTQTQARK
jgi:hypothetical protein